MLHKTTADRTNSSLHPIRYLIVRFCLFLQPGVWSSIDVVIVVVVGIALLDVHGVVYV